MQLGTGVFTLPREMANIAGTDGWITLFFAWLINVGFGILIVLIMRQFPEDGLPDLLNRFFGRLLGKTILIFFITFFVFICFSMLVNIIFYIKAWFLNETSLWLIMLIMVIPGYIIGKENIQIVGRYSSLIFFFTIWTPFMLILCLKSSHPIYLLPILKEGWSPVFQAVSVTIVSFIGNEVIYFIYPYLQKKQWAIRGVVFANTITLIIYLFVTLVCYVTLSPDEILEYSQPMMDLLKTINLRFVERLDMVYLALYIFIISSAWVPYSFIASIATSHLFGTGKHNPYMLVYLILFVLVTAIMLPSWRELTMIYKWIHHMSIILLYYLPIFLYIYSFFYNKYHRRTMK